MCCSCWLLLSGKFDFFLHSFQLLTDMSRTSTAMQGKKKAVLMALDSVLDLRKSHDVLESLFNAFMNL